MHCDEVGKYDRWKLYNHCWVGKYIKGGVMLAKKIALAFGIAIIFPMMIHYGVSTFSPQPKWKDYQIENYYEKHKRATPEEQEKLETERNKLEEQRDKAEKRFQKHLFFP